MGQSQPYHPKAPRHARLFELLRQQEQAQMVSRRVNECAIQGPKPDEVAAVQSRALKSFQGEAQLAAVYAARKLPSLNFRRQ